jgi:hypothetical protein
VIPEQTVGMFTTLFRGRGDVYGHEEGRCVKEPLTHNIFQQHSRWGSSNRCVSDGAHQQCAPCCVGMLRH